MRITFSQAVNKLKNGEVVAVPTETVYGLAATFHDLNAIEEIFRIKGRPRDNPLIIHVSTVQEIFPYMTEVPPQFEALAEAFWPGPLTCILPIDSSLVPSVVTAGLWTGGFRIPEPEITRALICETGPLVMPSANLSGRPSATRVEHVEEDFGFHFPVLEGGVCSKGIESTIIMYRESEWVILRLGAIPPEKFEPILTYPPQVIEKNKGEGVVLCPGQHFRHYAPRAHLYLRDDAAFERSTHVLGFSEREYPKEKHVLVLGSLFNPEQVAENLYFILRQLDQEGALHAWVDMEFPRDGLWRTIAERLKRAAEK